MSDDWRILEASDVGTDVPLDSTVDSAASDVTMEGSEGAEPVADTGADASETGDELQDGQISPDADAAAADAGLDADASDASVASDASDAADAPGDVAADGNCGNTQTDSHNCGYCGHDCCGGACVSGVCQPAVVASGGGLPFAIAVDATNVYWTGGNAWQVAQAPLDGGTVITLATNTVYSYGLAIDTKNVYFTVAAPNSLIRYVPIGGGTATTLAGSQDTVQRIVVDTNNAYWSTSGSAGVFKVPLDGGTVTPLAYSGTPLDIAVDGANVYWTDRSQSLAGLYSVPLDGGAHATLVDGGSGALRGVVVNATGAFFTNGSEVMKVPVGGGTATTVAAAQAGSGFMALDSDRLYWLNWADAGGSVMSVVLDGGSPTTVASGQDMTFGIAVDAKCVYWSANGGVMRTGKP